MCPLFSFQILSSTLALLLDDKQKESYAILRGWHKGGHGKSVQHSILGRVKKKLKAMDNVHVLSRFAPTTKLCFHCGTKHDEIKLQDRMFQCACGVCMDRDIHAAQCMVWMYLNDYKIPTERRNTMQGENKTSGKSSKSKKSLKKTKSRSLKLEAHSPSNGG